MNDPAHPDGNQQYAIVIWSGLTSSCNWSPNHRDWSFYNRDMVLHLSQSSVELSGTQIGAVLLPKSNSRSANQLNSLLRQSTLNLTDCTEDVTFWQMINMYRQQFICKHCHAAKNHGSQRWWMCCVIKRAPTTKAYASLAKIGITARSLFSTPRW